MKKLSELTKSRLLISLSGLLLGLTVIFAKLGAFAYAALLPLAIVLFKRAEGEDYRVKSAYLDGFIFYMSFDIVAFHWFTYFYPLDFAGIGNAAAIFIIVLAWIGLSALQSVFSALVFVLISGFSKLSICKSRPIMIAPIAAALFSVNEWTQTFTWAGVPWARIAISQTEMPIMMQSASLFGPYFLTFIIVLFNFLVAYAVLYADKRSLAASGAAAVLCMNLIIGIVLYLIPRTDESREITVASVQGNFQSQTDLSTDSQTYDKYSALTKEAVANGAQLVIWPEGAFARDIHSEIYLDKKGYKKISEIISDLSDELDVTIVLGTYVDYEDYSNSAVSVFYADGSSVINAYAKRHPVPFGEYLPLEDLVLTIVPVLAEINIFSTVRAGEESTVFDATLDDDAIKVGTLICFDSIYETLGIDSARAGAEMLIVPSNDSWFYDSRALYMHHSQNVLRAVEQGMYTVNCGNTGITSIVTDKGKIVEQLPIEKDGYVLEKVYPSSARTLYSYVGNLFVYICIAFAAAVFVTDIFLKKKL